MKKLTFSARIGRSCLWTRNWFNECSQQELSIFSGKQSDLQELPLALASPFIHHSQKKCYFLKYVTYLNVNFILA